jgi:mannose/fructose/N-acetylgalactosamine-specific phosphotransferase system component IID
MSATHAGTLFARSFLLQSGFGDQRRQALGFAWTLDPALKRAYADDAAGLAGARKRHLAPFNAQPHASGLILGAVAALEARAAAGDAAAAARAIGLKAALGPALSGAADAFFWGSLRPLAGALAVLVTVACWGLGLAHPCAAGAAVGLLAFNVPALAARWIGVRRGLSEGEAAAAAAADLPVQAWISGLRRAAAAAIILAAWAAMGLPVLAPLRLPAAVSFAAGAGLSRFSGGPQRLLLAAFAAGAMASLAGWTQ